LVRFIWSDIIKYQSWSGDHSKNHLTTEDMHMGIVIQCTMETKFNMEEMGVVCKYNIGWVTAILFLVSWSYSCYIV
jgi:hypothetical protein